MIVLPVLVALASAGDPVPTIQPSGTTQPGINPALLDACIAAPADGTAELIAQDDGDELSYNGGGYAASTRKCKRFVADFKVLASASPASKYGVHNLQLGAGPTTTNLSKANCPNLKVTVVGYKKTTGSFTKFGSSTWVGNWIEPQEGVFNTGCQLKRVSASPSSMHWSKSLPDQTHNQSATETFRVTVSAMVGTTPLTVKAGISFEQVPW
jgi:hypothetical protein